MAELTPTDVVDVLDADVAVEKRAQWGALEFRVLGDGNVEVVNASHDDKGEHTYIVHVESGIPSDWSAWEYQPGACKHMVAVAIREPIVAALTADPAMRADGGAAVREDTTDHSDQAECDCDGLPDDFPCWPCVRGGRKDLPDDEA